KYFDSIDDHINLTYVCKRLKLNMTKFHFNPLPLNEKTREYFPNLQTLYHYTKDDNLFEDDKRIIARKKMYSLQSISSTINKRIRPRKLGRYFFVCFGLFLLISITKGNNKNKLFQPKDC
ncbi:MAG: hypothetical protein J6L58_00490, partial [Clostridia bacterium]|nr:hypothetical protein [Clostridia bacterium]